MDREVLWPPAVCHGLCGCTAFPESDEKPRIWSFQNPRMFQPQALCERHFAGKLSSASRGLLGRADM